MEIVILSSETKTMLSLFILFLISSPFMVCSQQVIIDSFQIFPVPSLGPESIEFDSMGEGPYTGVNDGRVLKYSGRDSGFVEFAHTSPYRTALCDGTTDINMTPICGRPLGLEFNHQTNKLYIADAYYGLRVVGTEGGLATKIVTVPDDGKPLKWLDGLGIDQHTGIVYFTEVSSVYSLIEIKKHICSGDSSGRLLAYDPKTKKTKVLLKGLRGPGGVLASNDSSYVLVSETQRNRILKYWLRGPKAKTTELYMSVPAPANMKGTPLGNFWLASTIQTPYFIPRGLLISENGTVLLTTIFAGEYNNSFITEVHERGDSVLIGSAILNFVAST